MNSRSSSKRRPCWKMIRSTPFFSRKVDEQAELAAEVEEDLVLPGRLAADDAEDELLAVLEDLLDDAVKAVEILLELGVVAGVDLARLDGVHQVDEADLDLIPHATSPEGGRLLPDLAVPNVLPFGQRLEVRGGFAQAVALDDADVAQERLVAQAVGRGQAEELGEGHVFRPLVAHEQDQGLGLDELVPLFEDREEEGLVVLLEVLHGLEGLDLDRRVAGFVDLLQGLQGERRVDEPEAVGDPAQELAVGGPLLDQGLEVLCLVREEAETGPQERGRDDAVLEHGGRIGFPGVEAPAELLDERVDLGPGLAAQQAALDVLGDGLACLLESRIAGQVPGLVLEDLVEGEQELEVALLDRPLPLLGDPRQLDDGLLLLGLPRQQDEEQEAVVPLEELAVQGEPLVEGDLVEDVGQRLAVHLGVELGGHARQQDADLRLGLGPAVLGIFGVEKSVERCRDLLVPLLVEEPGEDAEAQRVELVVADDLFPKGRSQVLFAQVGDEQLQVLELGLGRGLARGDDGLEELLGSDPVLFLGRLLEIVEELGEVLVELLVLDEVLGVELADDLAEGPGQLLELLAVVLLDGLHEEVGPDLLDLLALPLEEDGIVQGVDGDVDDVLALDDGLGAAFLDEELHGQHDLRGEAHELGVRQAGPDLEALDLAEMEELGQVHVGPLALPEAAVDEQGVGREADREGIDVDEEGLETGHEVVDAALEGRMVGVVHRGHLEGDAHGPGHGADELVLVGRDGRSLGRDRGRSLGGRHGPLRLLERRVPAVG